MTEIHAVARDFLPADALLLLHRRHKPLHFSRDMLAVQRRAVVGRVGNEGAQQTALEWGADAGYKASRRLCGLGQGVPAQRPLLALQHHANPPRAQDHPASPLVKRNRCLLHNRAYGGCTEGAESVAEPWHESVRRGVVARHHHHPLCAPHLYHIVGQSHCLG